MSTEYPERYGRPGGLNHQVVGAPLASAATIAPTHGIHVLTGTAQVTTITPPWDGFAGPLYLLPDGASTFATGGNIAKAITNVAATVCIVVYNPALGLWYPQVP